MNKLLFTINLMIITVCSSVMAMDQRYQYTKQEVETDQNIYTIYSKSIDNVVQRQLVVTYNNEGMLFEGPKIVHNCEQFYGQSRWRRKKYVGGVALERLVEHIEDKLNTRT